MENIHNIKMEPVIEIYNNMLEWDVLFEYITNTYMILFVLIPTAFVLLHIRPSKIFKAFRSNGAFIVSTTIFALLIGGIHYISNGYINDIIVIKDNIKVGTPLESWDLLNNYVWYYATKFFLFLILFLMAIINMSSDKVDERTGAFNIYGIMKSYFQRLEDRLELKSELFNKLNRELS